MGLQWKRLDANDLEYAYNPQKSVSDHQRFQVHRNALARTCRREMRAVLDVPYGSSSLQRVDIFPAEAGSPVHLFFHGGYWRTQDKENFAFLAGTLVPAGVTTVVVNYDLCPVVTLDDVVEAARMAVTWTHRSIADYGGDPERISVSGNSAGAHLCSMLLATDWAGRGLPSDLIKGAVMASGIFDPEPVMSIAVNAEIGLTRAQANDNNSLAMSPLADCPIWVGAGGLEPWPWIEQSLEYSQHLRRHGRDPEVRILPGHNHFSIMDETLSSDGVIARAIIDRAT